MDPLDAHRQAQQAFAKVLGNLTPDQVGLPTPCSEWNVSDVVAHVVSGNINVARGVRAPVEGDAIAAYPASAEAAVGAFGSPDGMARTYRVSTGEVPATEYVRMRSIDLMAHAWDLARATGQPTDVDPMLAEELLAVARQLPRYAHRKPGGSIAPEQPCAADRPAADRLAAFLGRSLEGGPKRGGSERSV